MSIIPQREHGVIYRDKENVFGYVGWPSVEILEDCTLLAVCSGHRLAHVCPFGKSLMFRSKDAGKTWSAPIIVNDTVLDDRDAGILNLGNGKLLLTWFNHAAEIYFERDKYYYGPKWRSERIQAFATAAIENWRDMAPEQIAGGSFIRLSEDGGESWGEKIQVPVTAPHGPALLSDGSLIYVGNKFSGRSSGTLRQLQAYKSVDGGKNWNFLCDVPLNNEYDGDFCEPHCVELPNGEILLAIRYQGHDKDGESKIFSIFTSISKDGGKTFSTPQPTGLSGSPPHLMVTKDCDVVMSYGRRAEPFGERAVISSDFGRTWSDEYEIFSNAHNRDLGYPATVQLKDGTLLTVYYQIHEGDKLTSLLYTKWKYK